MAKKEKPNFKPDHNKRSGPQDSKRENPPAQWVEKRKDHGQPRKSGNANKTG